MKWVATRSESFLCDAQARDNVTDAELALDKDGNFLGFRAKIIAAIGAYLQVGMPAFTGNLGTLAGVYRTPASHVDVTAVFTHTQPVRPYRGNGRPEAAYVIERMVDLAADQTRHRSGGTAPAQHHSVERHAVQDQRHLHLRLRRVRKEHGHGARRRRQATASRRAARKSKKHGKLRGFGFSNTIERSAAAGLEGAEIRFDRTGSVSIFSGSINQGQGHETAFKQIVCDRLGLDPNEVTYIQGDTDQVFFAEGTGGSRSATFSGSAFTMAAEKVEAKGKAIAAHMLKVDVADVKFDEGVFSSPKTNQTLTIKEVAKASLDPKNLPDGMEPGLIAKAIYSGKVASYPERRARLRARDRRGDRRRRDRELQRGRRRRHRDQSAAAARPDRRRHRHGRRPDPDGRHQVRRPRARSSPARSWTTPCRAPSDLSAFQVESNPVPTKTNPLGVKGAGEAGCVGAMPAVANALVDALSVLGIKHVEMPATPEVLWRAIHEARAKGA